MLRAVIPLDAVGNVFELSSCQGRLQSETVVNVGTGCSAGRMNTVQCFDFLMACREEECIVRCCVQRMMSSSRSQIIPRHRIIWDREWQSESRGMWLTE